MGRQVERVLRGGEMKGERDIERGDVSRVNQEGVLSDI